MSLTSRWTALSIVFFLVVPLVRAQPTTDTKWSSSEPHESQAFGRDVAIEGAVAVVGAPGYDPVFRTLDYGAAYVYRYDGDAWVEKQKLTKPQPQLSDQFGRAVALVEVEDSGGSSMGVLVGMSNDEGLDSGAGAVYVYLQDGSGWMHVSTVVASDGAGGDNFGYALAGDFDSDGSVDGADFVVGAPRHNLTGFNREGAAYLYRLDNEAWVETAKLTASDAGLSAGFGTSVAMSGGRVLVGAPGDSPPDVGQNAGAAYIFEYDGTDWVETTKLTASDAAGQAAFGGAVDLDGDHALIGARLAKESGGGTGAAYVFRFDGDEWVQEAKLTAPDHGNFDLFGSSVALDGAQALVGAEGWAAPGGDGTGKAYSFAYDRDLELWEERDGFVPTDAGAGDSFGFAVAMDAGVALVGAPDHGLPAGGNGAIYVYGQPIGTSSKAAAPVISGRLTAPYPNPLTGHARLTLTLARSDAVRVSLFDLLGREVRVLHDGMLAAETPHVISVRAESLPGGIYVVRATAGTFSESRTVVIQR